MVDIQVVHCVFLGAACRGATAVFDLGLLAAGLRERAPLDRPDATIQKGTAIQMVVVRALEHSTIKSGRDA